MTGPAIHPRAAWGFRGWADPKRPPYSVADSARTEYFVHYEGATWTKDTGAQAMRNIDAGHRAKGWAGVGYNHVVMQDGSIWEGRGWGLVGAHCPNHNTSGYGVQVHIGGDQQPSAAALRSCRALYDEACRRAGRRLAIKGHRDGIATECPGDKLYAWVRAGLPVPSAPQQPGPGATGTGTPSTLTKEEGIMYVIAATDNASRWVWTGRELRAVDAATIDVLQKQGVIRLQVTAAQAAALFPAVLPVDVAALADALALRLPAGWNAATIAQEVADEMAARMAAK